MRRQSAFAKRLQILDGITAARMEQAGDFEKAEKSLREAVKLAPVLCLSAVVSGQFAVAHRPL